MHILDARWDGGIQWGGALEGHAGATRKLLKVFDKQLDESLAIVPGCLRGAARLTLKKGVAALHATMGSPFGEEVDAIAEVARASAEEIILANLSYDLSATVGWSTLVGRAGSGAPLHARSLDWPFPGKLLKTTPCPSGSTAHPPGTTPLSVGPAALAPSPAWRQAIEREAKEARAASEEAARKAKERMEAGITKAFNEIAVDVRRLELEGVIDVDVKGHRMRVRDANFESGSACVDGRARAALRVAAPRLRDVLEENHEREVYIDGHSDSNAVINSTSTSQTACARFDDNYTPRRRGRARL